MWAFGTLDHVGIGEWQRDRFTNGAHDNASACVASWNRDLCKWNVTQLLYLIVMVTGRGWVGRDSYFALFGSYPISLSSPMSISNAQELLLCFHAWRWSGFIPRSGQCRICGKYLGLEMKRSRAGAKPLVRAINTVFRCKWHSAFTSSMATKRIPGFDYGRFIQNLRANIPPQRWMDGILILLAANLCAVDFSDQLS